MQFSHDVRPARNTHQGESTAIGGELWVACEGTGFSTGATDRDLERYSRKERKEERERKREKERKRDREKERMREREREVKNEECKSETCRNCLRALFECTHGGALNLHTGFVQRVTPHTTATQTQTQQQQHSVAILAQEQQRLSRACPLFLFASLVARWTQAGSPRGVLPSDAESDGSAPCCGMSG